MSFLDKTLIEFSNNLKHGISGKNRIRLDENTRIKKVAFDMVKVYGDQYDSLWKVEKTDDGDFLIRASDPSHNQKTSNNWRAISDFSGENVTLAYCGVPVARFAANDYSFDPSEVTLFKEALLDCVSNDSSFVKQVFAEQTDDKVIALSGAFPELKEIIK
tara:strand:- start:30 stop:509 length:480 start_codon:yes stop_codon:yes gene_type:complete